MSLINKICLTYFSSLLKDIERSRKDPLSFQRETFKYLISNGSDSFFGKEHGFSSIKSIEDYQRSVPVRDYNALTPYINRLREGEDYVLWNQKTKWFAKSSGTSSDKSKFIPITKDNLNKCHIGGFKRLLSSYLNNNPDSAILTGKALTLGGSVQIDKMSKKGAFNGDLSAILLKNSPSIAELVRTPPKSVALTADFQEKIGKICEICSKQDVTNFSGVPSWNLVLIHKLLEYNEVSHLTDIWPNLELFMHGGINFEPYRSQYKEIIPNPSMRYIENYNASEGYFAFQDNNDENSMMLSLDNGVFYEFIPVSRVDEYMHDDIRILDTIESVEVGKQYAIIISTNSGLWRYLIGDCIEFTSIYPHKIKLVGRTQLYINAFGEELMVSNAENAISEACAKTDSTVKEYTVAPIFMKIDRKGAHQWVIEFEKAPADIEVFNIELDKALARHNSDYEAKRTNNSTMLPPVVTPVESGTFMKWMEHREKIGGQNKVPRLSNDRLFVEELLKI